MSAFLNKKKSPLLYSGSFAVNSYAKFARISIKSCSDGDFYKKPILKIVDNAQGQGENRFKSGAYTLVFEHFESVFNTALGRYMHFINSFLSLR
jgi:hypothetical protein